MANKKSVTHEFLTIEDIINNIHMGNKNAFAQDFIAWLDIVCNTVQSVKMGIEFVGKQKEFENFKPSELVGCKTMKWVDDGKHNISINVSFKK